VPGGRVGAGCSLRCRFRPGIGEALLAARGGGGSAEGALPAPALRERPAGPGGTPGARRLLLKYRFEACRS